jgi:hypothetical protein
MKWYLALTGNGERPFGAGKLVDQAFGTIGLEVAADLLELLAGLSAHAPLVRACRAKPIALQVRERLERSAASASKFSLRRAILSFVVMSFSGGWH